MSESHPTEELKSLDRELQAGLLLTQQMNAVVGENTQFH